MKMPVSVRFVMQVTAVLLLSVAFVKPVSATDKPADTMTGIFDPSFHTLQVRPVDLAGNILDGPAVMSLDGGNGIVVSFDQVADDRSYLRYELIHCDYRWVPEGLVDPEFLDGFNQAEVREYDYSQTTLVPYVNYRIFLPNEDMRPLLSGNYLLRVYNEDDPDKTLLQARFMVDEATAPITVEATTRTDFDYNDRHQQLSVVVDAEKLRLNDIFNDLRVVVMQDSRNDNCAVVSHPLRVEGRKAVFEHSRDLTFDAGNEYRRFEVINEYYPTRGVDYIAYADPFYHYVLSRDAQRAGGVYEYDFAQLGRYLIRRQNATDSNTEADYGVVHFALEMPELKDYDIFIEGDVTDRRLNPESKMVYNSATGCYEKALLLKQGAYSYQYLALPKDPAKGTRGLTSVVEGDFYPTQHEYTVLVYYREPGARYDRLAGSFQLFFGN